MRVAAALLVLVLFALPGGSTAAEPRRVVIIVWDGLRPDAVTPETTPALAAFRDRGVDFQRHHSAYPTQTMINAAALATGNYPQRHGFYGNWIWQPHARGNDARGQAVDFRQPTFTEDYAILDALDRAADGKLLQSPTLVEGAVKRGLTVAAVGKTGAIYLQDRHRSGVIIDEKSVFPLSAAKSLAAAGLPLPRLTATTYPAAAMGSAAGADPTGFAELALMNDGVTPDSAHAVTTAYAGSNAYLMRVLLEHVWPVYAPMLSIVWLRDPDTTSHDYGPGTTAYRAALADMDRHFGAMLARLDSLDWSGGTDVIVFSDHGHSTVAATSSAFPLRALLNGEVAGPDPGGYSVSGSIRTADLLTAAGFTAADGLGSLCNPVLAGQAGSAEIPKSVDAVCAGFSTPARPVPEQWPAGTHPVVVAPNGGSEYFYVPDHDVATVRRLVSFLQRRVEYGPVFVDGDRYPPLSGTLRLADARLNGRAATRPDVVASLSFDPDAVVQGVAGTEYSSTYSSLTRGMHGSLSRRDIHCVLIAGGPDFRHGWVSTIPSGNVDIAPTVAALLGISLPPTDGRVLEEALVTGANRPLPEVGRRVLAAREPTLLSGPLVGPGAPAELANAPAISYRAMLVLDTVSVSSRRYSYVSAGLVLREPAANAR